MTYEGFDGVFDFNTVNLNSDYQTLLKQQLSRYCLANEIDNPYTNSLRFKQNDAFTWNYFYSPITEHPITGVGSDANAGTWQALYNGIYNTPYPHLEPWCLQGFTGRPEWWMATYADDTGDRRWQSSMWTNILQGIIPEGELSFDGNLGDGSAGQVQNIFNYIPVNMDATPTTDGYAPDSLLPPYWDSSNTTNPTIRSIYDPTNGDVIRTPQLDFAYQQQGLIEWEWSNSAQRLYDELIVSFKIQPIKFLHSAIGNTYTLIDCLQVSDYFKKVYSHEDIIFHGDMVGAEVYKASGLNQWYVHYNRYNGFDGISSEFRSMWKDWHTPLSYVVGSFIDTPNLIISNEFFDITKKDYEINVKHTLGIDDVSIDSLVIKVLSVPSKYSKLRDKGIDWTFQVNSSSPSLKPIKRYEIHNYPFTIENSTTFRIDYHRLVDAGLTTSNKFEKYFVLSGNLHNRYNDSKTLTITDSTHFNGTYTIKNVSYSTSDYTTTIFVEDDISLPSNEVIEIDGYLQPENFRTLPDDWVTGTEVFVGTTGYLPKEFDDEIPNYLIRISDREFQLAQTHKGALNGNAITPSSNGLGEFFVGKLLRTFKALAGENVNHSWRYHDVDRRIVLSEPQPIIISGVQQLLDFIFGMEAYNHDQGFTHKSVNGENVDIDNGRVFNWQYVVERFIDDAYKLRTLQQESNVRYAISADSTTNAFTVLKGYAPTWDTGTQVVLVTDDNSSSLPSEFDNPVSSSVPYYVIRTQNSSQFKLATSSYNARNGISVGFSNNGSGTFYAKIFKKITKYPIFELNPFKDYIWVSHEKGIVSNIFGGNKLDSITDQVVYDANGDSLTNNQLVVIRNDKETRISLTGDLIDANLAKLNSTNYMAGMHLFLDGYEHIINFERYSTDNILIYDTFLGLNTPRFGVEFNRQPNSTQRPYVGGFVLINDDLVQNIESSVDDMRYYYDATKSMEGRETTKLVRKSLGYDGQKDYMVDLNINPKTQFSFWKGMIQNKGTNLAVKAFTNQRDLEGAIVDEYWAYKVAEFGDSKERSHPEMKLIPSDAVRKEMRLEFVPPDGTAVDSTFTAIGIRDLDRWWDQPDQRDAILPYESFFFDAKVVAILDSSDVFSYEYMDNHDILVTVFIAYLPTISDGAIITYKVDGAPKQMVEGVDYHYVNHRMIEFPNDPRSLIDLSIGILSYNYDAHTPSKLIDKKSGTVVTEVPIWHPAMQHYYQQAYRAVDMRGDSDPAVYNTTLPNEDIGINTWASDHVGEVWFDTTRESYVPYHDKTIFPDINDRIFLWGKLADWADIELYQWTESKLTPQEWEVESKKQESQIIGDSTVSGTPIKKLYRLVDSEWVEEKLQRETYVGSRSMLSTSDYAPSNCKIYVNGKHTITLSESDTFDLENFIDSMHGEIIDVIREPTTPSQAQLDSGEYAYFTPHTVQVRFDKNRLEPYNVYYYWVKNKRNKISFQNYNTTLYNVRRDLIRNPAPYMILQGLRTPDFGYGLIYGHLFDEFDFTLPHRYTQLVVKGLEGTIKDVDRYTLRFTRDFTLRDSLDRNSLSRKNVHVEWKVFREKQFSKIDYKLWSYVVDALVGYKVSNDLVVDFNTPLPSVDRVFYDRIYDTNTRFGVKDGQVFIDAELGKAIIISMLNDPHSEYINVDIAQFTLDYNFDTVESTLEMLTRIYNIFSAEEVNKIFVELLHTALSLQPNLVDFFKTSWVGIQISREIKEPTFRTDDSLRFEIGEGCVEIHGPLTMLMGLLLY